MIQEIFVTSLAFFFSAGPLVSTPTEVAPFQETFQGAMQSFQENVENLSTISQLQNSLITTLPVPGEKLFTEEQEKLIQTVKDEIQNAQARGNIDEAVVLDTSLASMLNAYAVAKGSQEIAHSTLSVSTPTPSALLLGKKEATDHLLQVRTAFVEVVDTLPSEKIERVESELMLAEQMLVTLSVDGGNETLALLKSIEQYIYHATFQLKGNT